MGLRVGRLNIRDYNGGFRLRAELPLIFLLAKYPAENSPVRYTVVVQSPPYTTFPEMDTYWLFYSCM